MRQFPAIVAAFVMTAVVGVAMVGVGANALFNTNTRPTLNSPASSSSTNVSNSTNNAAAQEIQQLQAQVQAYQTRDQQYQSQLNTLIQQVNQENQQIQGFQQLLAALQARGVIAIQADGTILIPRR